MVSSVSVCVGITEPFKSAVTYVSEGHTRRIRHRDSDVVDSRQLIFGYQLRPLIQSQKLKKMKYREKKVQNLQK